MKMSLGYDVLWKCSSVRRRTNILSTCTSFRGVTTIISSWTIYSLFIPYCSNLKNAIKFHVIRSGRTIRQVEQKERSVAAALCKFDLGF